MNYDWPARTGWVFYEPSNYLVQTKSYLVNYSQRT